jgi:hypothetical protein
MEPITTTVTSESVQTSVKFGAAQMKGTGNLTDGEPLIGSMHGYNVRTRARRPGWGALPGSGVGY